MRPVLKVEQVQDTVQITVHVSGNSADVYEFRVGWDGLPEVRVIQRNLKITKQEDRT